MAGTTSRRIAVGGIALLATAIILPFVVEMPNWYPIRGKRAPDVTKVGGAQLVYEIDEAKAKATFLAAGGVDAGWPAALEAGRSDTYAALSTRLAAQSDYDGRVIKGADGRLTVLIPAIAGNDAAILRRMLPGSSQLGFYPVDHAPFLTRAVVHAHRAEQPSSSVEYREDYRIGPIVHAKSREDLEVLAKSLGASLEGILVRHRFGFEEMLDPDYAVYWRLIYLQTPAVLSNDHIASATVTFDQRPQPVVSLQFDTLGTRLFEEMSVAMAPTSQPFAIVLDDVVMSMPVFAERIPTGRAQLSLGDGRGLLIEARALAAMFGGAYLSMPLREVSYDVFVATR